MSSANVAQRFELCRKKNDARLACRISWEMTRQCIEKP
jgi:hypothetical protein